jgi:hypothetical protein
MYVMDSAKSPFLQSHSVAMFIMLHVYADMTGRRQRTRRSSCPRATSLRQNVPSKRVTCIPSSKNWPQITRRTTIPCTGTQRLGSESPMHLCRSLRALGKLHLKRVRSCGCTATQVFRLQSGVPWPRGINWRRGYVQKIGSAFEVRVER